MARQAHFDPFGKRVDGYRAGVEDEMKLQDQTRRARSSDWDYQNMSPLRLNAAQRIDTLGNAALPFDIRALGIRERGAEATLAGQELPVLSRYGEISGNMAPHNARLLQYSSGQYQDPYDMFTGLSRELYDTYNNDPALQQPDYYQAMGQRYGFDPQTYLRQRGMMAPINQNGNQSSLEYAGFDKARQLVDDQRAMQIQQYNMNKGIAYWDRGAPQNQPNPYGLPNGYPQQGGYSGQPFDFPMPQQPQQPQLPQQPPVIGYGGSNTPQMQLPAPQQAPQQLYDPSQDF